MYSIIFIIFILGLFIGQWAYGLVLIYEGHRKFKLYRCPSCHYFLGFIPVLSWLFACGKCSKCLRRIDVRRPVIEFVMGFSLAVVCLALYESWYVVEIALFCIIAVIASAVDLKRTILPDTCTLGGIGLALLGAWINPEREFISAILGVVYGGGFLLVLGAVYHFIFKKEGMGGGDIKMLAWIGALVGFRNLLPVLLWVSILGTLYVIYAVIRYNKERKSLLGMELAFGPYLALATYLFILFSYPDSSFFIFSIFES
ncbi:MAG: A24 family peptidase [Bdellovibrionales bacterium]|nr:A24 family peptidase [Bdellovibrionales bacterium]